MEYLVGVLGAVAVAVLGLLSGMDRDRSFYPTILIVVASYYALFAVMGGSTSVLLIECAAGVVFVVLALAGFKGNPWLVAGGIAGHGVFDMAVHHRLVWNPGMPDFWPGFCATIDVALGAWLALRLMKQGSSPKASAMGAK